MLSPAIPPPRMIMCSADDGDVAMLLEANFCIAEADEIDRDMSMLPTI